MPNKDYSSIRGSQIWRNKYSLHIFVVVTEHFIGISILYMPICISWKIIGINKENEISLPNKEYISSHRWEQINVFAKCIVSLGPTGLDLPIGSAWDLRRFVILRLNTVIPFWNSFPYKKLHNAVFVVDTVTKYHSLSHREVSKAPSLGPLWLSPLADGAMWTLDLPHWPLEGTSHSSLHRLCLVCLHYESWPGRYL